MRRGFKGGVGEAGDEFEAFVFEGLEVDFAAHAAVKNEDSVLDLKASAKDFYRAWQRGGVGAIAPQDGDVERGAVGVGGDGQDDLGAIGTVVAAVPVTREGRGSRAFEIDAGEVIEGEADGGGESLGSEFFFQGAPVTDEGVHGGAEVVLVEIFVGWEAAGGGEQRAADFTHFSSDADNAGFRVGACSDQIYGVGDQADVRAVCEDFNGLQTGRPGINKNAETGWDELVGFAAMNFFSVWWWSAPEI